MELTYEASPAVLDAIRADPSYQLYWRRKSETQNARMAQGMIEKRLAWGRTPRHSAWPQVQAMFGPLPEGVAGIEFACRVPPDRPKPGEARWSWGPDEKPREGVFLESGKASVAILVTRCTQPLEE